MAADEIARAIIEEVFYRLVQFVGHRTARTVVPLLSLGRIAVAPVPKGVTVIPRWHGFHRTSNGSIVIDAGVGAVYGLLFWAVVLVGVFVYARF